MLKYCRKGEKLEQFLLLSTIFCYLMLDFYVKTMIPFSPRDKRLFEIAEVEITKVDCSLRKNNCLRKSEVSVERISVCNVIENLEEHGVLLYQWRHRYVTVTTMTSY